ncbi:DNA repair protein [Clostridium sp. ASBs410]|nr:DNA repair protein [Clostridium sp. ASBs410]
MVKKNQDEVLREVMKRPVLKKRVGIIRLQMVRESRSLYGMKRFSEPNVETVMPLLEIADREIVLVMSLNTKLEPLAVEIVAVGALNFCYVDGRDIFKHAVLSNAAFITCFHNHASGTPEPSVQDKQITRRLEKAGGILGIPLIDHIIIGEYGFYSFREHGYIQSIIPTDVA